MHTYTYSPGSSAGKESACNAGVSGSIPGSGSSPGEGIGYPLQNSWASLVAQMVKNPPAMWKIWVWNLGWEDPLEMSMATYSSILVWIIPLNRGAYWATVHRLQRVGHNWPTKYSTAHIRQGVGKGTEVFFSLWSALSPDLWAVTTLPSPLESLQRFSYIGMTD